MYLAVAAPAVRTGWSRSRLAGVREESCSSNADRQGREPLDTRSDTNCQTVIWDFITGC